jgi:hypothetical protein
MTGADSGVSQVGVNGVRAEGLVQRRAFSGTYPSNIPRSASRVFLPKDDEPQSRPVLVIAILLT